MTGSIFGAEDGNYFPWDLLSFKIMCILMAKLFTMSTHIWACVDVKKKKKNHHLWPHKTRMYHKWNMRCRGFTEKCRGQEEITHTKKKCSRGFWNHDFPLASLLRVQELKYVESWEHEASKCVLEIATIPRFAFCWPKRISHYQISFLGGH